MRKKFADTAIRLIAIRFTTATLFEEQHTMQRHEIYEMLRDTQMLISFVFELFERIHLQLKNSLSIDTLAIFEFNELLQSLLEILEHYQESELTNKHLIIKLKFYLIYVQEQFNLVCIQPLLYLINPRIYCMDIFHKSFALQRYIERELNRLMRNLE